MKLEALMNKHYNKLSENDLDILAYISKNKTAVKNMTIIELARLTLTSKSTILRLTKKLGFSGYSEFKYYLRDEKNKQMVDLNKISFSALQNKDEDATKKMFHQTDIQPILSALHESDRIFCYGTGWGQLDALSDFRRSLVVLNKFPVVLNSLKELEIAANQSITKNDLVIILSLSGDIIEAENVMNILLLKQIAILSITNLRNNHIASKATFNLYFQTTPVILNGEEVYSFFPVYTVMDSLYRAYVDYLLSLQKKETE